MSRTIHWGVVAALVLGFTSCEDTVAPPEFGTVRMAVSADSCTVNLYGQSIGGYTYPDWLTIHQDIHTLQIDWLLGTYSKQFIYDRSEIDQFCNPSNLGNHIETFEATQGIWFTWATTLDYDEGVTNDVALTEQNVTVLSGSPTVVTYQIRAQTAQVALDVSVDNDSFEAGIYTDP